MSMHVALDGAGGILSGQKTLLGGNADTLLASAATTRVRGVLLNTTAQDVTFGSGSSNTPMPLPANSLLYLAIEHPESLWMLSTAGATVNYVLQYQADA